MKPNSRWLWMNRRAAGSRRSVGLWDVSENHPVFIEQTLDKVTESLLSFPMWFTLNHFISLIWTLALISIICPSVFSILQMFLAPQTASEILFITYRLLRFLRVVPSLIVPLWCFNLRGKNDTGREWWMDPWFSHECVCVCLICCTEADILLRCVSVSDECVWLFWEFSGLLYLLYRSCIFMCFSCNLSKILLDSLSFQQNRFSTDELQLLSKH